MTSENKIYLTSLERDIAKEANEYLVTNNTSANEDDLHLIFFKLKCSKCLQVNCIRDSNVYYRDFNCYLCGSRCITTIIGYVIVEPKNKCVFLMPKTKSMGIMT